MDEHDYICLLAETLDKVLTAKGEDRDKVIAVANEIMERHRQMPQYRMAERRIVQQVNQIADQW